MYYRKPEGNWRSWDPEIAMRGVRNDMTRQELFEVVYGAKCGAARRIALAHLNDQNLSETFVFSDPDPLVRRGIARKLLNKEVLKRVEAEDNDSSVREAAAWRLDRLRE